MEITRENYTEVKRVILEKLGFTQPQAEQISSEIAESFKSKIETGSVTPPLAPSTIYQKKIKRLSKPDTPLYGTGDMAKSLKLGDWNNRRVDIVSTAKVPYQWHTINRAKNVPKREVLSHDELLGIVNKVMEANQ